MPTIAQETEVVPSEWMPPSANCSGDLRFFAIGEGAASPVDGQIFTNDAAACIVTSYDLCVESARLEVAHQRLLCELRAEEQLALHEIEVVALESQVDLLNDELHEALEPPGFFETTEFSLGLGFVMGAGAVVLVVWGLNQT